MKWLLIPVVLFLSACLCVWFWPEIVLTQTREVQLLNRYAGSLFSKQPESFKLQLKPFGIFGKRINLEASSFCLRTPDTCIKKVRIGFAARFTSLTHVNIEEIGPLEIQAEYFHDQIPSDSETAQKNNSPKGNFFNHVTFPLGLSLKDINLDLPKIEIAQNGNQIDGSLKLSGDTNSTLTLTALAKSSEGLNASLNLHTSVDLDQPRPFDAKITILNKTKFTGNLRGSVNWTKLQGWAHGSLTIEHLTPWFNTITINNLTIDREASHAKLAADIETKLDQTFFRHSASVLPKVRLDTFLKGHLIANEENGKAHYEIDLGPTHDKGLVLEMRARGAFPIEKSEAYRYGVTGLFLKLEIPVFADFVSALKKTNFSVPAPFSSLHGHVLLQLGNGPSDSLDHVIPVKVETDLASSEQVIKTDSNGKIELSKTSKEIKILGDSKISQFKFTLPSLKLLQPIPIVKDDERISSSGKAKIASGKSESKKQSLVELDWKISTAPNGIQIYHSVLKPFAPLEFNWEIGRNSFGSIELKPFEIEYLKHKAEVKSLRLYQNKNDDKLHYEGKIIVSKTDYTITVEIIQDGEKPKVVLTSSPPLQDSDVISVLLFNETTAELDSTDQSNSVASTQSAIASRALGLFSILALSSTPVEAVNYNASTGVYSARVKLANGLTATVGTDWNQNQEIALRKRLGRSFVLSAIQQIDPETNNEIRETLVEWFKRF